MSTSTRTQLSILETVFPPISNQEAIWLQEDPVVVERMRTSDFYMIAGRREAKFVDVQFREDKREIHFELRIDENLTDTGVLALAEIPGVAQSNSSSLEIEIGEKLIRIMSVSEDAHERAVLAWFTSEKILWDRSRGHPGIIGLERRLELATYDLLYVGIAKKGDSFDRLLAQGHKARMDILGNEPQRHTGARVTDEIYLFLFKVEPIVITTFESGHSFTDDDLSPSIDLKRVVADAEKAFVSLLKPQYNVIRFSSYPRGDDGLHGTGLIRYGYVIGESMAFNTAHGRIKGERDTGTGLVTNGADAIMVEGDRVSFYVSGVDFPNSGV